MATKMWLYNVLFISGYLYAIGGKNESGHLRSVEQFHLDEEKWRFVQSLDMPVFDHAATAYKDNVSTMYTVQYILRRKDELVLGSVWLRYTYGMYKLIWFIPYGMYKLIWFNTVHKLFNSQKSRWFFKDSSVKQLK